MRALRLLTPLLVLPALLPVLGLCQAAFAAAPVRGILRELGVLPGG